MTDTPAAPGTPQTPPAAPADPQAKPAGAARTAPPPPPAKESKGASVAQKVAAGAAVVGAVAAGAIIYGDDVAGAITGDDGPSDETAAGAAVTAEALVDAAASAGLNEAFSADAPEAELGSEGVGSLAASGIDQADESPIDESMDAFDSLAADALGGARGAGPAGPGLGGFAPPTAGAAPAANFAPPTVRAAAPPPPPPPPPPPAPAAEAAPVVLAEFEESRAALLGRLDTFNPPEGADPEEVQALREELAGMINRFQPLPGQSADEALAVMRDEFDQRVQDFVQDQKIEALVDEERRDNLAGTEAEAPGAAPAADGAPLPPPPPPGPEGFPSPETGPSPLSGISQAGVGGPEVPDIAAAEVTSTETPVSEAPAPEQVPGNTGIAGGILIDNFDELAESDWVTTKIEDLVPPGEAPEVSILTAPAPDAVGDTSLMDLLYEQMTPEEQAIYDLEQRDNFPDPTEGVAIFVDDAVPYTAAAMPDEAPPLVPAETAYDEEHSFSEDMAELVTPAEPTSVEIDPTA